MLRGRFLYSDEREDQHDQRYRCDAEYGAETYDRRGIAVIHVLAEADHCGRTVSLPPPVSPLYNSRC